MKSKLLKQLIYALLMILFFTMSYILFNASFNTVTKLNIIYQEKSTSRYEIKLLDNDIYDLNIKNNDWNILSNLIDNVKIYYNYKNIFSDYATGYYKYSTNIKEIIYKDKDIISEKNINTIEDKVKVIDKENIILFDDFIDIDYDMYKTEFESIKNKYDINPDAKLLVTINIYEFLSFTKKEDDTPIENTISFEIPLTDEIVRIKSNNISNTSKINELSKKEDVNHFLLLLGIVSLSLGLTFMVSVIKIINNIYKKEKTYKEELKKILSKNDDIIINVKKMINVKKYNLIYVDSFKELKDVYNKYKTPICFKETIKKQESIFLITNEDNAWIYKLDNF